MPSQSDRPAGPAPRRAGTSGPAADASRGDADRQREISSAGGRERLSAATRKGASHLRSGGARFRAAGPLGFAVLALGAAACALLVAAELAPVYSIDVGGLPCERVEFTLSDLCSPSGGERHSYALALLGVFALAMAWGAGLGGSRPAAAALLLAGAAVLAIVLVVDLPDVSETGEIGLRFDEAEASPESGFYLSLLGGGVALVAGVLGLLRGTSLRLLRRR